MQSPTVSIIIPVYNTEHSIRTCLDSVVGQTYHNLEIILIDDGSTDESGYICDEYAIKDSRIKAIHKEHAGVAIARNVGLMLASGEWIAWVDSDDWIEADMFEYLVDAALKYDADLAICGLCEHYKEKRFPKGASKCMVLDAEQALEMLLEDREIHNYPCDKIAKRSLYDDVQFPERHNYEDLAVMAQIFGLSKRIVCLPEEKYHYMLHQNGIIGNMSLKNKLDNFFAAKFRLQHMAVSWPQFENRLVAECVAAATRVWSVYYANPMAERKKVKQQLREVSTFCREHYRSTRDLVNLGITGRVILPLTRYPNWWAFGIARLMGVIFQLKYGRSM